MTRHSPQRSRRSRAKLFAIAKGVALVLPVTAFSQACSGKYLVGQVEIDSSAGDASDAGRFDDGATTDSEPHEAARTGSVWCECAPGTLEPSKDCPSGRPPTPPKPRSNDDICNYWDESEPGDCGIPQDNFGTFTCCRGEPCRGNCLRFVDEAEAQCICTRREETCEEHAVCCQTPDRYGCVEAGVCQPYSQGPY